MRHIQAVPDSIMHACSLISSSNASLLKGGTWQALSWVLGTQHSKTCPGAYNWVGEEDQRQTSM